MTAWLIFPEQILSDEGQHTLNGLEICGLFCVYVRLPITIETITAVTI
jgi:hypothetical protein